MPLGRNLVIWNWRIPSLLLRDPYCAQNVFLSGGVLDAGIDRSRLGLNPGYMEDEGAIRNRQPLLQHQQSLPVRWTKCIENDGGYKIYV